MNLAQHYRAELVVAFIGTSVLFSVDGGITVFRWICDRKAVCKFTKGRLKRLHGLTEDEKQILRFYIINQTRANVLRIDDGIVKGLESAGIIFQSSNIGNYRKAGDRILRFTGRFWFCRGGFPPFSIRLGGARPVFHAVACRAPMITLASPNSV